MNKYLNLTKERDDWSKVMAQVPQEEFINFEEWVMKAQDRKSRRMMLAELQKYCLNMRHGGYQFCKCNCPDCMSELEEELR